MQEDFIFYFKIGWQHILSKDALDHLYFISVLAVVYRFSQWKQLLILVTAFTIGHALTLFLSAMDLFRPQDQWVEFAIPCTIVLSCLANLRKSAGQSSSDKLQYGLALAFGLVHGMGYANTIRFMLSKDQNLIWSLFSFNIGLEVGQIFVVLLMLLAGIAVIATGFFNRREWVLVYSALVMGLAIQLALDRNPFFQ
jgi:hypothetical protein